MSGDVEHWSAVAEEWLRWARAPDHDAFWAYRSAFGAFVGNGTGAALEVGCGEGRVARLLRECGYCVTAADPVELLLDAARDSSSADHYALAVANALPFAAEEFDLVVAYNVLMDIEELDPALAEMRRVVRPTGTLVVSIVHPLVDRARLEVSGTDARLLYETSYFGENKLFSIDERDGITMGFSSWSRTLGHYVNAIADAGFAVTTINEPVPEVMGRPDMEPWTRHPLFLWLKAVPLG